MNCGHVDRKGRACVRQFHIGPHVYTRLARLGARKKRSAGAEQAFKDALVERSEGWCEASQALSYEARLEVCGTVILHPGRDPHHVDPKDRARNVHDPERGLWICGRAHDFIHQQQPARARELGLLR